MSALHHGLEDFFRPSSASPLSYRHKQQTSPQTNKLLYSWFHLMGCFPENSMEKPGTLFFFHLFLLVGGSLLYNIVVCFVIHWHESAMDIHVSPIQIPPPTSLSTWSLWVFPVHQAQALVSCIQPGLVICFTLDNIHVSMLFSQNIPPSPFPRVQKSVLYIYISFSALHIELSLPSF